MTNSQRIKAILNYEDYDRMPVVHFGYWSETLQKWHTEGRITAEEANNWTDGNQYDMSIGKKLGFDFGWGQCFYPIHKLQPHFETKVLEELPNGSQKVLDSGGVIVIQKPGITCIPAEVDHILKDRQSWQEHYLPKLQYTDERVTKAGVQTRTGPLPFDQGGREYLQNENKDEPIGLHLGSLLGMIRNWTGLVGLSYITIDDEKLLEEMIETIADLSYKCTERILSSGAKFDFAHFWEDICCKSGPLVNPTLFAEKAGAHYKRLTDLVNSYGINIVSLDCDGCIDALIPTWLENGVNTMFPIEVGTWNASIEPWRKKYGKELRGVGGMRKAIFSQDRESIDAEIERLKALVALGGFIPCPDHRIAPTAKWELVQYYCEKMHQTFS